MAAAQVSAAECNTPLIVPACNNWAAPRLLCSRTPSSPWPHPALQGAAKELADSLRSKGGIEEHSAIAESLRVQYFRGEDFVTYVQEHPGLFNVFSKGAGAGW